MLRFDGRSDDGTALRRWREEIARAALNLDVRPHDGVPFQASIVQLLDGPGVRVIRWRHTAAVTRRDAVFVERGEASYSFIVSVSGLLDARHLGREVQLRPGDGILLHNAEPGCISSPKNCDFIAVLLDEHMLVNPARHRSLGRVVHRTNKRMHFLRRYINCLGPRPDGLPTSLAAAASRHVAELVEVVLQDVPIEPAEDAIGDAQSARLSIALQFISENYRNPDLNEHLVASQQGISVRQLQRAFEQAGLRFSAVVAKRRLDAARCALWDPSQANRQIADIALSSGFSDISHFNRLFRRAYDATPTAIRSCRT